MAHHTLALRPLRPFAVALTFLTRLPIELGDVHDADLGRSVACFPAVGLALGLVIGGTERLLHAHISAALIAVVLTTLLVTLTGGLHLDGLADVFDGLGGSRGDREQMLVIMRDSRIGALGAAAMVLALAGKIFAILESENIGATWSLFFFPVAARWAVTPLVVFFPYARREGLGRSFNAHARTLHVLVATLTAVGVLSVAGMPAIAPTAASLLAAVGIGFWLRRRLGGLTGDVYGAAIELSEIAFLIVATMRG